GEFRVAERTGVGVAARPRDGRCGTGTEQVHPVKRAVVFVEADCAALDEVFADVVAIEVKVEARFEFARVRTAARELALPPPRLAPPSPRRARSHTGTRDPRRAAGGDRAAPPRRTARCTPCPGQPRR